MSKKMKITIEEHRPFGPGTLVKMKGADDIYIVMELNKRLIRNDSSWNLIDDPFYVIVLPLDGLGNPMNHFRSDIQVFTGKITIVV